MFPCFTCGRTPPSDFRWGPWTIRGCCPACDPGAHRAYRQAAACYESERAQFLRMTGVEPLADWYAFERWRDAEEPALYDVARQVCHAHGIPWTDPRTGVTYPPPDAERDMEAR